MRSIPSRWPPTCTPHSSTGARSTACRSAAGRSGWRGEGRTDWVDDGPPGSCPWSASRMPATTRAAPSIACSSVRCCDPCRPRDRAVRPIGGAGAFTHDAVTCGGLGPTQEPVLEHNPGRAGRPRLEVGDRIVGCMTMLVSLSPATRQASADVASHTGRLEKMIVRAVPGHVAEAERLVTASGGLVGRKLSIISGFAARVPVDAANDLRAVSGRGCGGRPRHPDAAAERRPGARVRHDGRLRLDVGVTQMVGAQALWAAGHTGQGVDVALVDTGVAPVPASRPDKIVNGPDLSLDYQYGLAERSTPTATAPTWPASSPAEDAGTPGRRRTRQQRRPFRRRRPRRPHRQRQGRRGRRRDRRVAGDRRHRLGRAAPQRQRHEHQGAQPLVRHPLGPAVHRRPPRLRRRGRVAAAASSWSRRPATTAAPSKQLADPAYDPRLLAVGGYDAKNSKDPKKWVPADFTNARLLEAQRRRVRARHAPAQPACPRLVRRQQLPGEPGRHPLHPGQRHLAGRGSHLRTRRRPLRQVPERDTRPDQDDPRRDPQRLRRGRRCSGSSASTRTTPARSTAPRR